MRETYEESKESGLKEESDCIDYHLFPGTKQSHTFPGGHSEDYLRQSFTISSLYLLGNEIEITIHALRIGHAYPTGELFRALKLKVYDTKSILLKQFVMRKKYRFTTMDERLKNDSPKFLEEDTKIPAPKKGKDSSSKILFMHINERQRELKVELCLDYLNDVEHIIAPLNERIMKKLIIEDSDRRL